MEMTSYQSSMAYFTEFCVHYARPAVQHKTKLVHAASEATPTNDRPEMSFSALLIAGFAS